MRIPEIVTVSSSAENHGLVVKCKVPVLMIGTHADQTMHLKPEAQRLLEKLITDYSAIDIRLVDIFSRITRLQKNLLSLLVAECHAFTRYLARFRCVSQAQIILFEGLLKFLVSEFHVVFQVVENKFFPSTLPSYSKVNCCSFLLYFL